MPQPRQPNPGPSRLNAKQGRYRWDTSSQFVDIVDIYTLTKEAPPPGGVDTPCLDIRCYALIARVTQLQRGAGAGSAMQHKASPRTEWELQEKGKSGLWKKGLKILRLLVTRHHMLLVLVFILLPLQFPPSPRPRHRPLCNTARTFAGDFPVSRQSHEISSLLLPRIIVSAAPQVRLSCHTFMCVKVKPDDINITIFS